MEAILAGLGAVSVVLTVVLIILAFLMPYFVYQIARYQRLTFELLRDMRAELDPRLAAERNAKLRRETEKMLGSP